MAGILNAELAIPQFPALDQYGPNTTLLLHGDGTNGAQNNTFLDSSANNFTITRNGNTTQGTFGPFSQPNGYWSNYFNQTTTSRLKFPSGSILPSSTDFTIECWIYPGVPSNAYNVGIIASQATTVSGDNGRTGFVIQTSGSVYFSIGESFALNQNGKTVPFNQWTHVAVTRSGNTFTMYFNGNSVASASSSKTIDSGYFNVGTLWDGDGVGLLPYQGYISNLRVVGSVVYSSNFTPPTTPLTAISGTNILTCQSNRFLDNSTNSYVPTVTGAPSVQAFHPISAPTAYYPAVNGGAGYFDGSGDYLSVANSTSLDIGSSSFTLECWYYQTSSSGIPVIFGRGGGAANWNTTNGQQYLLDMNSSNIYWETNSSGSDSYISATLPPLNQWNHVAIGYNGTTTRMWINGVSVGTISTSYTIPTTTNITYVGYNPAGGTAFTGYISNLRFVKGTDVYGVGNTSITVPTSPFTAIANTQLLLSMTNGGIIDSVSQNQLETVGNAQVSTTQSKFGGASMYFDGSSYLLSTTGPQLSFGNSDFTLEYWLYFSNVSTLPQSVLQCSFGSDQYSPIFGYIYSGGTTLYLWLSSNGSSWDIANGVSMAPSSPTASTWNHVAVTRSGSTFRTFWNGTQIATFTSSSSIYQATNQFALGCSQRTNNPNYLNGYIDDFRFTKGIARYTQNFTPPQNAYPDYGPLTNIPTVDPNFKNTTLLLHGNGTNGAQNNTFLDSSTNNFTITRNGNTTQGTFTPFSQPNGWWSNYFGGSDYLSIANNTTFDITGTFTLEFWYYQTSSSGTQVVFDRGGGAPNWSSTNGHQYSAATTASGTLYIWQFQIAGNNLSAISTTAPPLNTWNHVAIGYNGTTTRAWLNGVSVGTSTSAYVIPSTTNITRIANASSSDGPFYGYVSNLRFVKGTDVYGVGNTTITVPTSPLTAITNTSLLTCQSNRFIDNSTNAFTITPSGTPTVQNFYPFFPPLDYSTAAIGGSGYFDGSGDVLSAANNAAFGFGTGNFCVEFWMYPTALGTARGIYGTADTLGLYIYTDGSNKIVVRSWATANLIISNAAVLVNTWTHIAVCRSGTTLSLYVNGSRTNGGTATDSTNFAQAALYIGAEINTFYYAGYIAGLIAVKGSAVYDPTNTTITVPTAPPTAITNTSLLLNFTNGGIFDNASKNDFETVSNAQISTTQSKFGGSSMYFDASGSYLSCPSNPNFALGTGDFTVEYWVYPNDVSGTSQKGTFQISDTAGGLKTTYTSGMHMDFGYNGSSNLTGAILVNVTGTIIASSSAVVTTGAWYHIAAVRLAGVVKLYVNGTMVATGSATGNITGTYLAVGCYYSTSYSLNGYIDDFRITSGICRYPYNFTPPAAPFPNK